MFYEENCFLTCAESVLQLFAVHQEAERECGWRAGDRVFIQSKQHQATLLQHSRLTLLASPAGQ